MSNGVSNNDAAETNCLRAKTETNGENKSMFARHTLMRETVARNHIFVRNLRIRKIGDVRKDENGSWMVNRRKLEISSKENEKMTHRTRASESESNKDYT